MREESIWRGGLLVTYKVFAGSGYDQGGGYSSRHNLVQP